MWAAGERVRGGIDRDPITPDRGWCWISNQGDQVGFLYVAKTRIAEKVGDGQVQDINHSDICERTRVRALSEV